MRLSDAELDGFLTDGYVARPEVFGPDEVKTLREVVEEVAANVTARATREGAGPERAMADGHRIQFSSRAAIQWEWRDGSHAIRVLEPCTHLDPRLEVLWDEPRLVDPMRDVAGVDELAPFTSKLNMKRADEGSEFPWHQDFPYWYAAVGWSAGDIATTMILLDDAYAENGALRVLPGSHRGGAAPRDPDDPSRMLADPSQIDDGAERIVEVPAGSVISFGAFLLHRSSPNTSGGHRRALLLSYQPAGRPRLNEMEYRPERVRRLD